MAQKFHVNKETGAYGPCDATAKPCPLGENAIHFDSLEDAMIYSVQNLEGKFGVGGFGPEERTLREPTDAEIEEYQRKAEGKEDSDTPPSYSFVKAFEQQEKEFEIDFDGMPTSFFNKELGQQGRKTLFSERIYENNIANGASEREALGHSIRSPKVLAQYLMDCASSPKDLKMDDEQVESTMKSMGFENIQRLDDDKEFKAGFRNAQRGWVGELKGNVVIVSDDNKKSFSSYSYRGRIPDFLKNYSKSTFTCMDIRRLAGNERIKRLTGTDIMDVSLHGAKNIPDDITADEVCNATGNPPEGEVWEEQLERRKNQIEQGDMKTNALVRNYAKKAEIAGAMRKLEDAQDRGKNFKAQQKFVKGLRGSVATAYMDKKNPDKAHQEMMQSTPLNASFRHVEIDNDVDSEEMSKFEKDYAEISDKLPPMDKNKVPNLRIRKLGKHKATGMYFPHTNDIAIDVRDSSSFIHEYGHYLDLTVKNNASLGSEFRGIAKEYKKNLTPPDEKKRSYYETPTEILARGWTVYAHEKLGIKNTKLLNESKLDAFDHEPFKDPKLKADTFKFFDKLFAQNN